MTEELMEKGRRALEEAEEILRGANALVERTVREIRERQAEREAIREAKRRLEEHKRRVREELSRLRAEEGRKPEPSAAEVPLRAGARVLWKKFGTEALVLDEPDTEGRVLLEAGAVKVRVPVTELAPAGEERSRPASGTRYQVESLAELSNELDVRGLTVDEALEKVGFRPEKRRFSPHLTLGRIRRRASPDAARAVGAAIRQTEVGHLGDVVAERIIFFRSVLKSSGAEYTPLAEFELGG